MVTVSKRENCMEFSNYEQVREYGTAFKIFSESYMTGMPLENVKENLGKIEGIMRELPGGDSDGDIDTHYVCLGNILNKLRLEYTERALKGPEAEKQKRLSKEWLDYFGADVPG